jgi:NADPH:quinone reductase
LLILGAGGGIGSFAVQLASNSGILALAASRSGRNRDFMHKLGAHRYFDSANMRFLEDVKMAYPDGVDALLDLVSTGDELTQYLPLIRKGGIVASTKRSASEAAATPLGLRAINVNLTPRAELLDRLAVEFSSGRMRVPLEETVPLAEAPQALERNRSGESHGKVVLKI